MKNIAVLLAVFFAAALFAETPPANREIIPISEVKPGMTARGYSVFKGSEVTVFEAEVIDVQQIGVVKEPVILCRLKGDFFEKNGVIEAMSGSPLYVGDRFMGAVALGWAFSKEPICGATPAEQMVSLYDKRTGGGAGKALPFLSAGNYDIENYLNSMRGSKNSLSEALESLKAQGFAVSSGAEKDNVPGSGPKSPGEMIGVQLVQGDIEFAAFGTVSSVKDNSFIAFGHPFFGLGETDFPVVRAYVSAIMPSLMFSFKISGSKEEIGRMVYDSPYGIICEKNKKADLIPVELNYTKSDGMKDRKSFRIVRHPSLSRTLFQASISLLHDQMEGNGEELNLQLDGLRFDFENGESLKLSPQVFGGALPSSALSSYLGDTFSLLTQNSFKKEKLAGIAIDIKSNKGRNEGKLVEIKALSPVVCKGDPIEIRAVFVPYEGEKKVFNISIPSGDLPVGEIKVLAGDNLSIFKRTAAAFQEIPNDFSSLKSALKNIPAGGTIVTTVISEQEGEYYDGKRVPSFPPSFRSVLPEARESSTAKSSEKVLAGPISGPQTGFFEGLLEIKLSVKEREKP
jgi:hypothetical protein